MSSLASPFVYKDFSDPMDTGDPNDPTDHRPGGGGWNPLFGGGGNYGDPFGSGGGGGGLFNRIITHPMILSVAGAMAVDSAIQQVGQVVESALRVAALQAVAFLADLVATY